MMTRLALALLALLSGLGWGARPIRSGSLDSPAAQVDLPPGTINIALLGIDRRPTRGFQNTDVIIIASINPDIPSATLLSIPRDWPVVIPGRGVNQVNQAYALGGAELFKATMLRNFGLKIDYFAMVNFEGLVRAVDTLGGVDVVATCRLYHVFPRDPYYMGGSIVAQRYVDTFSGEVWEPGTRVPVTVIDIPEPGVYSLNGFEALAFVRARYGVPGGDRDRGRREQRVVRALLSKARQLNAIPKIPQLIAQIQDYVQTDLPLEQMLYFVGIADRFNDAIIHSRFLDPGGANGAALLLEGDAESARARRTWSDMVQKTLSVALNQRPNDGIPIEVWNGTSNPDFALAAVDRLSELGFRIVDVQAADRLYDRTTIIDYTTTPKGSAVPLLTRTFGIRQDRVVAQPSPDGPRYRIIVGPDFRTCYYDDRFVLSQRGSRELPAAVETSQPVTPTMAATYMPPPTEPLTITAALAPDVALADAASADAASADAAPADAAPAKRVTAAGGDTVNVRSGPGTVYAVIGGVTAELAVPLIGRSADERWLQVQWNQRVGWVSAEYARTIEAPPAEGGAARPALAIVPSGDAVNVRTGPGTSYPVIITLGERSLAPIVGRSADGAWWQVRLDNRTGWLASHLVQMAGGVAGVPVAEP